MSVSRVSTDNKTFDFNLRTSETDWPSLKVHFTLKRDSMHVYGHTEFDVYLNPVVLDESDNDGSASVLYDGYVDFSNRNTLAKYSLVNGIAYSTINLEPNQTQLLSTMSQCLPINMLPPLNEMLPALNAATPIASANLEGIEIKCTTGHFFKVMLQGLSFVICVSDTSGFHVYGSDMEFEVKYLKIPVQIVAPKLTASAASECKTVVNATVVTATTVALLTGKELSERSGSYNFGSTVNMSSTKCSCMSTPRPCLFIHGLGIDFAKAELQDSFSFYWGNLTDHAPCCTDFKYMIWNSIQTGWNNQTQQQIMCDLATSLSGFGSPNEIADTIVVTHSMGGLVLASAIASGKCTFAESSSWIATSAPMSGSMGSDYAEEACAGKHKFVMEKIGNVTGVCPVLGGTKSLVYEGGKMSWPELNDAYKAARKVYRTHVHAALCSNWYVGLFSRYQFLYALLGATLPHKSNENDGLVEFESCAGGLPREQFHDHYTHRFYVARLNHADATFYYGDGLFSSAKKPVKWFECVL
ncbi:unnamed protein product [Peronospora belbahrii]|uniref:Uncharacterized protein n=1 Tax=Peronospora belbahrii TaxID=622444 RepID=A0ABN8CW58_9STRA|nr:unnamed protein product [Peronospora belbahrii]